jgi:hypothetical protein
MKALRLSAPATRSGLLVLAALVLPLAAVHAQTTNAVAAVGSSAYRIGGTNNPALTLTRGRTYVFNLSASGHPFWIKTARITGTGSAYNNGVTGNGRSTGQLTFVVPIDAPSTLYYICEFHSPMTGTLNIIDPPVPPEVRILSVAVGAAVVVQSTGVAGWRVVPEFLCDAGTTNWTTLANFDNSFANGTNTTTFDRLEPVCGPTVLLRLRVEPE